MQPVGSPIASPTGAGFGRARGLFLARSNPSDRHDNCLQRRLPSILSRTIGVCHRSFYHISLFSTFNNWVICVCNLIGVCAHLRGDDTVRSQSHRPPNIQTGVCMLILNCPEQTKPSSLILKNSSNISSSCSWKHRDMLDGGGQRGKKRARTHVRSKMAYNEQIKNVKISSGWSAPD